MTHNTKSDDGATSGAAPVEIVWDETTQQKFIQILEKVPVFMRGIAQEKVSRCAEALVRGDHRREVTEKDMVDAFFKVTPFGFHGPLKSDLQALGVDYSKYGYES